MGSVRCSTVYPGKLSEPGSYWRASSYDDDMCQIDDKDDLGFGSSVKFNAVLASADLNKVINYSWKSLLLFRCLAPEF